MRNLILIIIGLLIIGSTSCDKFSTCIEGEGSVIRKEITISDFSGVDLAGVGNVIITQGDVQEVIIESQSNIIERLKTNVYNDVWIIELEKGCYKKFDLNIYVTLPNLNEAVLSGSGNISVNNFYNQPFLELNIPGSGNIELDEFNSPESISININGSGNITFNSLSSSCNNLNIDVGGSGNIKASGLLANNCNIDITGSTTCEISVNNSLDVTSSGSGTVYYKGAPDIYTKINPATTIIKSNK